MLTEAIIKFRCAILDVLFQCFHQYGPEKCVTRAYSVSDLCNWFPTMNTEAYTQIVKENRGGGGGRDAILAKHSC